MSFGRFGHASSAAPMGEINMTPLIDVMLVLLVIFIITAPLMVSSVRLELPRAARASASDAGAFVALSLDASGQVFLDAAPIAMADLERALQRAAQANPDTEVRLRADVAVPYGRVVSVMGLAQKAGLSHIGFVALPTP